MTIKTINRDKIKVLLTASDMERLKLTYEELDYQNQSSKRALSEMLSFVKTKTGVDFTNTELYIEAFSNNDGSCAVWFSRFDEIPPNKRKRTPLNTKTSPVIYEFKRIDDAAQFARACLENIDPLNLYSYNGHYRLVFDKKSAQRFTPLLAEFGQWCGSGSIELSFLDEHGELLLTRDTLKMLRTL